MFKKIYFKIEYILAFVKKNLLFFLLGTILGSLSFVFQNKLISLVQLLTSNQQHIGLEGRFNHQNLPPQITNLITYGLTQNTPNHKPEISPIVDSLKIENNNKDYIFQLKPDIRWHDNKKLTSHDINYQIAGINLEYPDKHTVKISTQETFAPLLSLLNQPLFKKGLIGLGDYQVQKIQYQYGFIKTLKLKPLNDDQKILIYHFYNSQKDLITAFKLGEVDQIRLTQLPKDLTASKNIQVAQSIETSQQYSAIFFNTQKIKDKQFRQSLAYATPKTKDKNERCLGPISPNSWAYNPSVKQYNFDINRAKQLLKEAKDIPASINLSVNDRQLLALAEKIKQSWQENLNIQTTVTIENQIDKQNFDAVLAHGAIPSDPDQYSFWHSTQHQTNLSHFTDERIDKLLEEGRQIFDPQERKKIYLDFQKHLLEECPAIFLSYPTIYTVSRVK